MLKHKLTVSFFFITLIAFSQQKSIKAIVKTIKETNSVSKEVYVFPKVIVPNNKIATTKINDALLEFLQIESKDVKKSVFENVWLPKNENCAWIYHYLKFKVLVNNDNILGIDVSAAFGKHSFNNTEHYLFDIKTGDRINLNQLLNPTKVQELAATLYFRKDSIIKNFLVSLDDSLKHHQNVKDSLLIEQDSKMISGYNECLGYDSVNEGSLEYVQFYFLNNKFYLILGNCSSWVSIGLDDLSNFHLGFTFKEIEPFLSEYGKKILNNKQPPNANKSFSR